MTQAPTSTYRLQIRESFTLAEAAALVDYLHELGVGALYLSPLLTATSGSDHGYDTTDVSRIDPSRGGDEGWQHLLASARAAGIGVVVDIVPNHLGIAVPAENPAWWDVLRLGQRSPFARWFDIDWTNGPLIIPVLGDDGTLSLEQGELRYFEHRFPIAPGTAEPGDTAADVHDRQHYRLVHHSRGDSELNYRRFFTVTTLAGVRIENPVVLQATHARVVDWVQQGIAGLRVDHPDGLVDPAGYLKQLRHLAPEAWITVEKILEPGERLPTWPVDGTTGYDAMREVDHVFVDPRAEQHFSDLYVRSTQDGRSFEEHARDGKRLAAAEMLVAEGRRMAALVPDLPEAHQALVEIAISFDVYRSYLPDGLDHLESALRTAQVSAPQLADTIDALEPKLRDPANEIARRFQQFTGAVMAKGVEDTAYYRYSRFLALNEVGGDPSHFGADLDQFHRAQQIRLSEQPLSMTAGSTHDTKRGEDVRARLAVLSELATEWTRLIEHLRSRLAEATPLDPAFAYLILQTFVGAGMIERDRMHSFVEKAMREAKSGTSWTDPQQDYEAAAHAFVDQAYDDEGVRDELSRILMLVEQPGWSNALGQKLVQLTMPGVPDVYQGTELWDDSLVDPDNRRPVDFAQRREILSSVAKTAQPPSVDASGAAKLWVTRQALRLRRDRTDLFTDYRPIRLDGPLDDHLLAFDRGGAITVATRLSYHLAQSGGWRDAHLDLGQTGHGPHLTDVLTGHIFPADQIPLATLLDHYPVALLIPHHP